MLKDYASPKPDRSTHEKQNPESRSQNKNKSGLQPYHSGFWILTPEFCLYRLLFPLHTLEGEDDAFYLWRENEETGENSGFFIFQPLFLSGILFAEQQGVELR